jgi:hypothetical protein
MTEHPAVYAALAAVASDIAKVGIAKDRKNEQQGYKFRGIDEVLNALSPLLAKHKLLILPRILTRQQTERTTAKGTALFSVVVEAEFDFVSAEDGSIHTVRTFGEGMDSADKATNKAMSAAYKYAAFQAFCIPLEGALEEADRESHDVAPKFDPRTGEEKPTRPTAPHGFEPWWATLPGLAGEGMDALKAAWGAAPPDYRKYIVTHLGGDWGALKVTAEGVGK